MSRQVINKTTNAVLANRVITAASFWARLKGLLGTKSLPSGEALLIKPCNGIHTIGMRYAIDVLFISASWQVLKVVPEVAPMRGAVCFAAAMVLELPAGTVAEFGVSVGHQLTIMEC
jgi:hypothetical protein